MADEAADGDLGLASWRRAGDGAPAGSSSQRDFKPKSRRPPRSPPTGRILYIAPGPAVLVFSIELKSIVRNHLIGREPVMQPNQHPFGEATCVSTLADMCIRKALHHILKLFDPDGPEPTLRIYLSLLEVAGACFAGADSSTVPTVLKWIDDRRQGTNLDITTLATLAGMKRSLAGLPLLTWKAGTAANVTWQILQEWETICSTPSVEGRIHQFFQTRSQLDKKTLEWWGRDT